MNAVNSARLTMIKLSLLPSQHEPAENAITSKVGSNKIKEPIKANNFIGSRSENLKRPYLPCSFSIRSNNSTFSRSLCSNLSYNFVFSSITSINLSIGLKLNVDLKATEVELS